MSRLFAPALGILVLALLIGCGGDTSSSGVSTSSTSTTATTGTDGTTSLIAPAGTYTAALASTVNGAASATGTGAATAASNGTITLSLSAANTSNATARSVSAVVAAADGSVTGTTTVGAASATTLTSGNLAKQSNGTYLLTIGFTNASAAAETDAYTLTAAQVAYNVAGTGTDTLGARYTDTGTATLGAGNTLTLSYASSRAYSGATTSQNDTLSTTLLSNGTFSGVLNLGFNTAAVTGTWSLGSNNALALVLTYANPGYVSGTGTHPTVTENLTLTQ